MIAFYCFYLLLLFNSIYIFFFVITSFIYKPYSCNCNAKKHSFVFLIPAYAEDNIIIDTIENLLSVNYPSSSFKIILIADSFKSSTIDILKKYPIQIIEEEFCVSSKSKALKSTLPFLSKASFSIILDADNHVDSNFLNNLSSYLNKNCIYQLHRKAKNLDTNLAILDAISEEVNNCIFRAGHSAVGLSSALIGSGIVIHNSMINKFISNNNSLGGFDKELELQILKDLIKIQYLDSVVVYDEKVSRNDDFINQRSRWINAQFKYLIKGVRILFDQKLFFNLNFIDKLMQFSLIPRIWLLPTHLLFLLLFILINNKVFISLSVIGLLITIIAIFLAIPKQLVKLLNLKLLSSIVHVFFLSIIAL
ncbi:MAG: glycosyltransferase family 2 protein, partial [Bacteroidales bacterium]